jgi:hypothetical protein
MRAMRRRSPKPGDLLEIKCPRGFAYVHYIGRDATYGDAVFVYPKVVRNRISNLKSLDDSNAYVTYYPAKAAVKQGLVQIVATGNLPAAAKLPVDHRREGATNRAGDVLAWIVARDGHETLKRRLTTADRKLPIASVWNHEYLIERIVEGWNPQQHG